ncbi:hypothetical protein OG909_13290 [Streptomyces sp. NBC_01754]|nr:hypothetical protein [Streptomyces sp. NBC_01754]WSC97061.1 hypothetical protein OG909_13290 [Streptomyces sp. NBC_01754]
MATTVNVAVVHYSSTGTVSTIVSGQGDIPVGEETPTAARVQARRVVQFTRALKAGLAAES